MNTLSCQCIKEYWESRYESLTLTGSHLGDLTLMEDDTTDKLHVIVHHVPSDLVSACHPVVLPYCVVAFNADELLCSTEVTVKLCCLNSDCMVLLETTCC